jgi:hypothetical protein
MANVSRDIITVSQDILRCPLYIIGNSRDMKRDPNTCQHDSNALLMPLDMIQVSMSIVKVYKDIPRGSLDMI